MCVSGAVLAGGGARGRRPDLCAAVAGGRGEGGDDAEHRQGARAGREPRRPHGQDDRPRGARESPPSPQTSRVGPPPAVSAERPTKARPARATKFLPELLNCFSKRARRLINQSLKQSGSSRRNIKSPNLSVVRIITVLILSRRASYLPLPASLLPESVAATSE